MLMMMLVMRRLRDGALQAERGNDEGAVREFHVEIEKYGGS